MTIPMNLPPQTWEPVEFVSDVLGSIATPNPETRTLTDPDEAAELIAAETRSRVKAVLEHFGGTPSIMLSGGVDSIYIAAIAVALGGTPRAVTIVTGDASDEKNAVAAASSLKLPHDVIRLSPDDVVRLAQDAMRRLGTTELWEITAGIPMLAARSSFDKIADLGPILTGSGADAIFAGGRALSHPLDSSEARTQLDHLIRTESAANFRYERLVPHFHPALLDSYAPRLVHTFQTVRWWQISETLAPQALFGNRDGRGVDKLALRIACERELPNDAKDLAWASKSPIQRSSGLMEVLATAARQYAADLPGATTYTNPLTEDPEAVATRLYLSILNAR